MLKTPVSILQELTVQRKLAAPDYQVDGTGESHCMSFTCYVKAENQTAVGVGATKKDAKQDAAKNLLKHFGINLDNQNEVSPVCFLPKKPSKTDGPKINYIGKLNEFCFGHGYPQPAYNDDTLLENDQFCTICTFNSFKTKGFGYSKKDAKQNSAKKMLELIKENDLRNTSAIVPVEKFEENSEISKQVVKKYSELMNNIVVNDAESENNNNDTVANGEEDNISTWEELIEVLNKKGYKHELSTFQDSPLILSLTISNHTLMNCGNSKEEIMKKMVQSAVDMMKQGIDFSKPLSYLDHPIYNVQPCLKDLNQARSHTSLYTNIETRELQFALIRTRGERNKLS